MLPWNDAGGWSRLRGGEGCALCWNVPPDDVIAELSAAWIRVPTAACLPGYACVIARRHVVELHESPADEAAAFVADVCRVSAAVTALTGAAKINLLSLGNLVPHLHVHVCPRRPGDRFEGRPLDPGDVRDDIYNPGQHAAFVQSLRAALRD